eukprot:TRINITY_DN5669_c0_g1_i1.p2 TRINITY_DN5669_c0_g1~~TRINITY_DN5669_c0_g1_i1.p2  ORF type:complete len:248 (+),score=30.76 TRINITY_DN5669_c0_g1_i1:91-834(+)
MAAVERPLVRHLCVEQRLVPASMQYAQREQYEEFINLLYADAAPGGIFPGRAAEAESFLPRQQGGYGARVVGRLCRGLAARGGDEGRSVPWRPWTAAGSNFSTTLPKLDGKDGKKRSPERHSPRAPPQPAPGPRRRPLPRSRGGLGGMLSSLGTGRPVAGGDGAFTVVIVPGPGGPAPPGGAGSRPSTQRSARTAGTAPAGAATRGGGGGMRPARARGGEVTPPRPFTAETDLEAMLLPIGPPSASG